MLALAVAVLALLVGSVAAVQSWRAADKASQALERIDALAVPPPVVPATPVPTESPTNAAPNTEPVQEPTDLTATGAVPVLDAQTQYKERYAGQNLRVPADCNEATYVDLDEPRVKVDSSAAEFYHEDPCGSGAAYLKLSSGVEGSVVNSAVVTPFECAEHIRTSPMSSDSYPTRRGQVYCIMTSLDTARATAGTWKMVLLEVTATGQDGTVTFKASAWNIPD
ncbi:hypothetical protein KZ829_24565 [Actinoplanes hulinensis]|uniref:Serine/threonine protein kinase n=1 Tax=Actinoplanes hulinensis TaxID=1144547 RepID=A0ABS7B7G0_9ACTN|nr:hypothetical protein [Actinoplanes hulinensis]MBW6436920.1 hypothetical protein [Actinoplanes hulinensis]